MEPEVFARLNELRRVKIESELVLKRLGTVVNEETQHLRNVENDANHAQTRLSALRKQLAEAREDLFRTSWDASLMVALKQGQDEVYKQGTLRKMPEAMLVKRTVIERENVAIRGKGADKKAVLSKIIDFRKSINVMEWEHKYMDETVHNQNEHYTDLHMLRVKRSLQEFLKGNTKDKNKKEMAQLERKLKYMQNAIKEKQQNMQKKLRRHERQLNEKLQEQKKLEEQQKTIAQRVVQLEAVNRTRVSQEGKVEQAKNRMKSIVTRRKLIDLARAQTDEIDFLRQELDRIRQRTFPSFAHSRRAELSRMGNPDELF